MNKTDINSRVNGLNEYMLSNGDKQLLLLTTSSIYTYNKALAIIEKSTVRKDWYSIDNKNCFKTWNEVEVFLDGLCLGKNTDFHKHKQEER